MKAASHAQALAGTLNVSATNAGIGLGAIVGGYTIERSALANIGYVAVAVALLAALIALAIGRHWPALSTERLKGIEVFVALAEAGSFTAAAERLHLTTSAVSKTIARLEARLGARLFERTTRRLALTSAGEAFHRTCTRILTDLEAAEIDLAAEHVEPAGRLRVDVPVTFGHLHVLPLLLDFAERHPRLKLHTSFTDRFVDPVEEGIDVAVRIGSVEFLSGLLAHRTIGHERVIFCTAPRYLQQRPAIREVTDLERHDCVTYGRADGSVSPWVVARPNGQFERRTMNGRIVVGSGEAQVQA